MQDRSSGVLGRYLPVPLSRFAVGGMNLGKVFNLSRSQEHSEHSKNAAETSSPPLLSPHQVFLVHRHPDEPVPLRKFVLSLPRARGRLWGALLHGRSLFSHPTPHKGSLIHFEQRIKEEKSPNYEILDHSFSVSTALCLPA